MRYVVSACVCVCVCVCVSLCVCVCVQLYGMECVYCLVHALNLGIYIYIYMIAYIYICTSYTTLESGIN